MSVISLSSGLCSQGKEVARRLADKLSYECISREVLLEASEIYNIPEIKLTRAIKNAPSILDRIFYGKEKYVAYIKDAILSHLQKDNCIYYGLAGHFFLQGIPHVLKVRVVSSLDDRIQEEIRLHHTTPAQAKRLIEKDDEERRKWGQHLYHMDTTDPSLYDLVINLSSTSIDKAVDLIIELLGDPRFQTTESSKAELERRSLEARVYATIVNHYPSAKVSVSHNKVFVSVETGNYSHGDTIATIENLLQGLKDRVDIEVSLVPIQEAC